MLSYSSSRVIQEGKSLPNLTGSADWNLRVQSISHMQRASENQCWIYRLSLRLLPLFADSTTVFLSSFIRVSFLLIPLTPGAAPLLLWSSLGIPFQPWPLESRRMEENQQRAFWDWAPGGILNPIPHFQLPWKCCIFLIFLKCAVNFFFFNLSPPYNYFNQHFHFQVQSIYIWLPFSGTNISNKKSNLITTPYIFFSWGRR